MKMQKKTLITLIIIVAVVAIGIYSIKKYRDWQEEMHPTFYSGNGRLEATEIYISNKIAARIERIFVAEGQLVKKGEKLVKMRTAELEAQLEQAKAQVEVNKAKLMSAQATLLQRESEFAGAEKQYDRDKKLLSSGTVAQKKFEDSETAYKAAQAELAAARAQVKTYEAEIQAAEADAKFIMSELDDSILYAPTDGRIQYLISQEGEVLAAGGRVLNMIDLTDVYFTFFLPEYVAGRAALGTDVRIVLDAAPRFAIPANVSFVASVAQFTPKSVETQLECQKMMFRVKARIDAERVRKQIEYVKTGLPGVGWVQVNPTADWHQSPIAKIIDAMPPLIQEMERAKALKPQLQAVPQRADAVFKNPVLDPAGKIAPARPAAPAAAPAPAKAAP
ncbi:MAG: efflux RND transporter periplasmic adaptor subunit, partial [Planctomycetes bacterium]|nr:efflux RND transporter periplasmic adaptor subunit [Planctomycetota bacterium]